MTSKKKIGVVWEGPQLVNSSLGLVNRYLCSILLRYSDIELQTIPIDKDSIPNSWFTKSEDIKRTYRTIIANPSIHIRQQWPPSFSNFRTSIYIMFQPWEYGTVPKSWIKPILEYVDEIWVNSEYTKKGYINSGIPLNRIYTFPLGVDPEVYHPSGPKYSLKTSKKFKFLFVGGTIFRKGIDLILEAYLKSFTAQDDVCLVIKDHGGNTHYKGQTYASQILEAKTLNNAPEIIYIDDDLSPYQLAELYRSCDCLVHPYRGEGFGLPILEAMACGIPPIIPDRGPAIEFTTESTSFRVISEILYSESELETCLPLELITVDKTELALTMKYAFDNIEIVKRKGKLCSDLTLAQFTWDKVAELVHQRIVNLSNIVFSKPKPNSEDDIAVINIKIKQQFELKQDTKKNFYSQLLKCFSKDDTIIDVGYGDTIWHELLKNYVARVEIINSKSIAKKDIIMTENVNNIDYIVSNLGLLSINIIDGLTFINTIEQYETEDLIRFLYYARQVLSYRGHLLIITARYDNEQSMEKFWLKASNRRPYPLELIQSILNQLGFRSIISGGFGDMDYFLFASLLTNENPFVVS